MHRQSSARVRPGRSGVPGVPGAGRTYRFAAGVAFGIFALQRWQFEVDGLEHVPTRGGAVVAANHTSFWDYFTVGREPYQQLGRPIRILAKESLFRAPVFGPLMHAAEHIPVQRGGGSHALDAAVDALRRGELVLVLPEQTISPSFELLPFKTGAARMAIAAGVPLIPSISWGSHRFHTVGRRPRFHWRLPVHVAHGQPLHPGPDDDPEQVTAELRTRMGAMLERVQAGYPAPGPGQDAWWQPARLGGTAPTHREALDHLEQLRRQWQASHPGEDDRGDQPQRRAG